MKTTTERMYDAINEAERVREDLYEAEARVHSITVPLAQAYALAFGSDPGKKDAIELAANLRDWIRTVKTRPASSHDVEATAVAVIERCATEAGLDVAAARERVTSEVGALIYVGDALAVMCRHGAAYVKRCRKRWRTDGKAKSKANSRR